MLVDGSDHEGGFAHLSGGEDVAELMAGEGVMELAVCCSLDVGGAVGAEAAAYGIEGGSEGVGIGPRIGCWSGHGMFLLVRDSPSDWVMFSV
jgi:hypothetical protein